MRLLIDARHLPEEKPSGIGRYVRELLPRLLTLAAHDEVTIWTSGQHKPTLPIFLTGLHRHQHTFQSNRLFTLRCASPVRPTESHLFFHPYDAVFLPHVHAFPIFSAPTVLVVHDVTWQLFPEWYSQKMRLWHALIKAQRAIQEANYLLTPSKSTAYDIEHLFPTRSSPATVVPHGVSPLFTPKPSPQDSGMRAKYHLPKTFALFVGTLEPRKNLVAVCEAVEFYRIQTGKALPLVIVGKWGWQTRHMRAKLTSMKDVIFLGYLSTQEQAALYRMASVCVWPSIYEGFGLPPLEAMASGCPVITSNTSSLPEVTASAASLVHPFHPRDIGEALCSLLSDPVLYNTHITRGLLRAKEHTWEQAAHETYAILKSIRQT